MRHLMRPVMYLGVLAIVFAASKYHAAEIGHYDFTNSGRFAWASAYVVLLCLAAYALGLPDLPRTRRSRVASAVGASVVGALGMSIVQLFSGDALLPRFVVLGSAVACTAWFVMAATAQGRGRAGAERRDQVVLIGDADLASVLGADLAGAPEKPAALVSFVDVAVAAADDRSVTAAVEEHGATVVVLTPAAQAHDRVVAQVAALHESGVRVRTLSLFYEEWLGKIPVADLGRVALFFDIGEVHRERYGRAKRLLDVTVSAVGLVPLLLVIPVVVVGDLVGNRGPLFYVQERVGRSGARFRILKFRSMRPDVDIDTTWTTEGDPRITGFGAFLRRSHLDELPQLLNILRGDLSLVGPRPEQPRYVSELKETLPYYDVRHLVRPGLTGWAQVKYGYAGDERDAVEKLQYDFHYLRRQGVLFDLRIIGRTIRSVIGGMGR